MNVFMKKILRIPKKFYKMTREKAITITPTKNAEVISTSAETL